MYSCDVSIIYDCAPCGNKSGHNMSSHASQPIKTTRTNLDYRGGLFHCRNKKSEITPSDQAAPAWDGPPSSPLLSTHTK